MKYIPESMEESTENIRNPFRGWYRIVYFLVEEDPEPLLAQYRQDRQYPIELVILNISAYREAEIPREGLDHIRQILEAYRQEGVSIILRPVYDHQGKAAEKEPFFFDLVCQHMRQISACIGAYGDCILMVQGLLIGNWGELHSSRFAHTEKLKTLVQVYQEETKGKIPLAMRKPSQWRKIRKEEDYQALLSQEREWGQEGQTPLGLFDDAILASEDDLGTFGQEPRLASGWEDKWMAEDELVFEQVVNRSLAFGGELVGPEDFSLLERPGYVMGRLQSMGLTYLNHDYDKRILDYLAATPCKPEDLAEEGKDKEKRKLFSGKILGAKRKKNPWEGNSMLDYIGAHLGYRYWVADSCLGRDLSQGGKETLQVELVNSGFAGICRPAAVYMEWLDQAGERQEYCLEENLMKYNGQKHWKGQMPLQLLGESFKGEIYLSIRWNNQTIVPANTGVREGKVKLGSFQ